ncbi:hypothetical protein N7468_006106 [Penicillium chermesinum]|uniref:Cytochrome P450 n=1 Tax=Penicillium chermesinum TaxID=63820 RepID=A0A9W9P0N9_9EURO|nr:uncharacterized protein N7468_006106 [Penicillium chermesinum]KAJ5233150.1 hypothetical protein N7468_006106 [Penicillium chermesinum]
MAFLLLAVATLALLWPLGYLYNLVKNLAAARRIGVPIVVVPVNQSSLWWLLIAPSQKLRLQRLLPRKIWERIAIAIFGFEFHEKLRPFEQYATAPGQEMGKTYVLVGLGWRLDLWTTDPHVTQEILTRVRDFEMPKEMKIPMGQFGPNILMSNGDEWQRHRRAITSVIDERVSKNAFEESIRQARHLLDDVFANRQLEGDSVADTTALFDMLKTVTINVLLGAGMGLQTTWGKQEPEDGYELDHRDSLVTVVSNIAGPVMFPSKVLRRWPSWLPGHARNAFVDRRPPSTEPPPSNILSKLVHASENGKGLNEPELVGHQVMLTAAGFESTSTTLAFALVLLARYPQWQEWVFEEADELMPANTDDVPPDYSTHFPRVTRALAFMLETMRLYPPVPKMHREVNTPQTLQTSNGQIHLPAGIRISANTITLHLLPEWRDLNRQSDPSFFQPDPTMPDEFVFRPSRWINPPGSDHAVFHAPKGLFIPWGAGPRICPGTPLAGEQPADTEKRLARRLTDSRWVTVLQMNGVFDPKEDEALSMRLAKRAAPA